MKIQTSVRVEEEFYLEDNDLIKFQEVSMSKTWDNKEDEAWGEV